jgi:hypothetical protein
MASEGMNRKQLIQAVIAVGVLYVALSHLGLIGKKDGDEQGKVIQAQRFEIVDKHGRARGSFGVDPQNNAILNMTSQDGRSLIRLRTIGEQDVEFCIQKDADRPEHDSTFSIRSHPDDTFKMSIRRGSYESFGYYCFSNGWQFIAGRDEGSSYSQIRFASTDEGYPRLRTYNRHGQVMWQTPAYIKGERLPPPPRLQDDRITWTTLAHADLSDKAALVKQGDVAGLTWVHDDGGAMIKGTTVKEGWQGTRRGIRVEGDDSELVEVSALIQVGKKNRKQLIVLWGNTEGGGMGRESMCLIYNEGEGDDGAGFYRIQTRYLTVPNRLADGLWWCEGTGEETERFHKMRMVLDRKASAISYFADGNYIGTVKVHGEIGPLDEACIDFETPNAGVDVDVRYKDLTVRSGVRNSDD